MMLVRDADTKTVEAFLAGLLLAGIRISGLFIFTPFLSSDAISMRVKASFALALTIVAGPVVLQMTGSHPELNLLSCLGELGIALIFGLSVNLILEIGNLTGQLLGLQFSFTLVNLMDPNSRVETTLFSQMLQLMVVTLMVTAGMDHALLRGFLGTFSAVPIGSMLSSQSVPMMIHLVGGVFGASLQLAAPLFTATIMAEVAIAAMARLSPQLPVNALTIPTKTILGFLVLLASITTWNAFIERSFDHFLTGSRLLLVRSFDGVDAR